MKNHSSAVQSRSKALVIFLCVIGWPKAQGESDNSAFVYSSQLNLTSNYIWRGLSQTGQAGSAGHLVGIAPVGYVCDFFVSNVTDKFITDAALENDFTVGYKASAGPVELDTGGVLIVYPGSNYDSTSASPHYEPSAPTSVEGGRAPVAVLEGLRARRDTPT